MKYVCSELDNINLSEKQKYLNALQILHDEEFVTYGRVAVKCYSCASEELETKAINCDESSIKQAIFLHEKNKETIKTFEKIIFEYINLNSKYVIPITYCKHCNSILSIGDIPVFDGLPITFESMFHWKVFRYKTSNIVQLKVCKHCGGNVLPYTNLDGTEIRICTTCSKLGCELEKSDFHTKYLDSGL